MHSPFYEDIKTVKNYSTFRFTSIGKTEITKVVEFQETLEDGVYNLAMGDLIGKDFYIDTSNSNNGDIKKVLTTVVNIVQIYTKKYPERSVFITGNTQTKNNLYQRIIRMYYQTFKEEFNILGYLNKEVKEQFDPNNNYVAFIVKRK